MTARTPLAAAVAASLLAVACAGTSPPARDASFHASDRRVLVAPLNMAVRAPAILEDTSEPVWDELLHYLGAEDGRVGVLDAELDLWDEVMLERAEAETRSDLPDAASEFARRVASERDFDMLVIPSLVVRKARVAGWTAAWDGVRRPVPTGAWIRDEPLPELGIDARIRGLSGNVAAASLHVMVLDANGESLFDGMAGVEVIQRADRDATGRKPWTLSLRPEPFTVPDHVRDGIERAFQRSTRKMAASW